MKILKIYEDSPSERQLEETARDLKMGSLAIIPTDSIYAIVCNALDQKAIDRLCRLKGINTAKANLSIICCNISMAAEYARIDNKAFSLLKEYTPGPYTFLLPAGHNLPKAFKGRRVVGVRIPDCNTAKNLSERMGGPLLTTSIEFEDSDYAINPELIAEAYHDKVDIVIEGADGDMEPSTIIDITGDEPEIKREGKGAFPK